MLSTQWNGIADKRVLITGGTSGLGFAMARALVAAGAKVVITGREPNRIDSAVKALGGGPGEIFGVPMDVRDEASVRSGVDRAVALVEGLDVLVNNAGIGMRTVNPKFLTDPTPFWEISYARFSDLIETNLAGYFLVAKHVVPLFLAQGHGRIVNISMNHETMRRRGFIPYGPSRAATESLSQIMGEDLQSYGVTVNMLLPGGATDTGMIPEEFPSSMRPQLLAPDVMAAPILFLCSNDAKAVHGERIVAKDFSAWLSARSK